VRRLIEETPDRRIRAVDYCDEWARLKKHPEVLDAAVTGRLQFLQGDATNAKSMEEAFQGIDGGVILAFQGGGFGSAGKVDHNGVKTAVEAATRAGVQRVLLISSLFVTDRHKRNPIRIMLNTLRWRMMDNKLKGEQRVREAGVPYTIVRPGRFVSKPQGAPVKLKTGQGDTISGSICPVDVAAICVAALRNPATSGVTFEVVDEWGKAPEDQNGPKLQQEVAAAEADGDVAYPSMTAPPAASGPGSLAATQHAATSQQDKAAAEADGIVAYPSLGQPVASGAPSSAPAGAQLKARPVEEQLRTLFLGLQRDAAVATTEQISGMYQMAT